MQKFSFSELFATRVASNEGAMLAPQCGPIELAPAVLAHVGGGLGPNGTWTEASIVEPGPNGTW